MGVVVAFDFSAFTALFPEMTPVGVPLATAYFGIAETMHANDGSGPIGDATLQSNLLYMLTAHLAQLFAARDASGNPSSSGAPSPTIVGRISSASEGSVSVQAEALEGFNTAQASWLAQTKYGALYWAATAQFRTFRYRRPRCGFPGAFPLTVLPRSPWR